MVRFLVSKLKQELTNPKIQYLMRTSLLSNASSEN